MDGKLDFCFSVKHSSLCVSSILTLSLIIVSVVNAAKTVVMARLEHVLWGKLLTHAH